MSKTRKLLSMALALVMLFSLVPAATAAADDGKIDVWDFGAEQLDESIYNNKLTVDEINSWYPAGTAPGTPSNTLPSFESATGISFNDGGKPNTHRVRTMNEALTRFDAKSLTGEDGTVYQGYIYSNSGKNPDVYLAIELNAGDKVTVIAGSNGGESLITFTGPDGDEDAQNFTGGGGNAQTMVFYPRENGLYKFWSATEKLVIARIYRQAATDVTVSGQVSAPAGLSGYSIAFTNTTNGAVTAAEVSAAGTYSTVLPAPFTYDVSLLNANGYVVDAAGSAFAALSLDGQTTSVDFPITVNAVPLVTVSGKITGLSQSALADLTLAFTADAIYQPQVTVNGDGYTAVLEQGATYAVSVSGVNDYDLSSAGTVTYTADAAADVTFAAKPTYQIAVAPSGITPDQLKGATFTFTNLNEAGEKGDARLVPYNAQNLYPYTYTFTGADDIRLRDGEYDVKVSGVEGFAQALTSNLKVSGAPVTKAIAFKSAAAPAALPYRDTVTVGPDKDYATISDAVAAVRAMDRADGQRVTIAIDPGNYEEMLVVDVPNVTLKNASATPSLKVIDQGVNIDPNAVRVTWYYGCGYNYYSMNDQCKYDPELLAVNRENGYESFVNPGDGVDNDSYWNSTVLLKASGIQCYGIIFENSFNQYVSPKSVEDVIVPNSECKENKDAPRAQMKTVGDTTVQDYTYKERAGALAITDNCTGMYFENCKFIGRQDTLYGGDGVFAAFYDCAILGSTDYIYGPMTAVFAKCDLVFNTSEHEFDRGYITAPRHTATRGFLLLGCTVKSTTPSTDTASTLVSKAGYFGRPWQAATGEAVFVNTFVEPSYGSEGALILPEGWLDSLSGRSALCGEYGTVDGRLPADQTGSPDLSQRASWAAQFADTVTADGTAMDAKTWLNGWDAFASRSLDLSPRDFSTFRAGGRTATLLAGGQSVTVALSTFDGQDYVWIRDVAKALADTDAKFNIIWDNGVSLVPGESYVPSGPESAELVSGLALGLSVPYATSVNGAVVNLDGLCYTDPQGGAYTFYKLTDLAPVLGVTVQ